MSALQPVPEEPVDVEAERTVAHAAGYAAGEAAATAALAPLRKAMVAAAAELVAAGRIDAGALRPLVLELVRQLSEAVIGAEISSNDKAMQRLVDAALEAVVPGVTAVLRAHPATLAGLGDLAVATEADAGMGRDEIVVSGADFVIEAGLSSRLAEIMEEIA